MSRKRAERVSEVNLNIRQAVKQNPGIHFRGLARAARVTSAGQLRHHLDRLERQGILVEIPDGRYKRFFTAGDQDPKLRPEMARFTRVVPRRIAKLLLVSPMNRTQLRRSLGCADSTLGYHLSRMVTLGDLARERGPNTCVYSLTSGETVRRLLIEGAAANASAPDAASNVLENDAHTSDIAPLDSAPALPIPEQPLAPPERSPPQPMHGPDGPAPYMPEDVPDLIGGADPDFGLSGLPI